MAQSNSSKPSGASNPAGIIPGPNPAGEQRGIISNGVKAQDEVEFLKSRREKKESYSVKKL